MKIKDQSIETLRGIAIILVVAGYIIRGDLDHETPSVVSLFLDRLYYYLKPIRMPLFTVISAYLYASSPVTRATFKKLITGKTRRIMVPFAAVSAIQYLFYSLFQVQGPHPLQEIYRIYLWPHEQFWFLLAIFWIFIVVGILDAVKALETKRKWLAWLALAGVFHVILDPPWMFAVHGANYLFPFFLMGYGFQRFSKELFTPAMIKVYATTALCAYVIYAFHYSQLLETARPLYTLLSLFISFSAMPLIFHFRRTVPLLAKIGYYAFGIHIFNKISSAFPRMLFDYLHIDNEILIVVTYLACGIVFSIGIQIVLEQFALARKYILGMKDAPETAKGVNAAPALSLPAVSSEIAVK